MISITTLIREILDNNSSNADRLKSLWDLNLEDKKRIGTLGADLYRLGMMQPNRCFSDRFVLQQSRKLPSVTRSLRSNRVLRILHEQRNASTNGSFDSFFSPQQAVRNDHDEREEAAMKSEDLVRRTLPADATSEERDALFWERYTRVHDKLMADERFISVRPLQRSDCTMHGLLNTTTVTECVSFVIPDDPYYQELAGINKYGEDLCEGDATTTDISSMSLLRLRRGYYSRLAEYQYQRMADCVERNGEFIFF